MRNFFRISVVLILAIGITCSSCSSTNIMTLGVTEPAPVYIPGHIQKIGIIDRSLPSEENASADDIDRILSAEGKNLDKDGAHNAVLGLYDELYRNKALSEVKIIENAQLRSPGLGIFPAKLPWKTIRDICQENDIDALYILSFYDTDSKIDYKTVPVKIKGPLGVEIPAIEHHATITTLVKTGWRVYNSIDEIIHDEYRKDHHITSKGKGINPAKAIAAIVGRKEAVLDRSNTIGHNYGARILPYRIRVSRDYFVSGTDNFEIAKRRAQAGNWDSAAELWNREVSNSDGKIAGKACYNMAIISEIHGDLDKAVEWASRSYEDYNNKTALRYINILKNRIRKNNVLRRQREGQ